MSADPAPVVVPPPELVDDLPRCPDCHRTTIQHTNPHGGRRWTCAEIGAIEARVTYYARPRQQRAWLRLTGRRPA